MLYQLCYIRQGQPKSCTFFAADLAFAAKFVEAWESITRCPVLTMRPLGDSKFSKERFYNRTRGSV